MQEERVLVSVTCLIVGTYCADILRGCRYDEKKCCLPVGGPPSSLSPPAEKQCPHGGWSWSQEHNCCIPHHPRGHSAPAPQCIEHWQWSPATSCCERSSHPSGPSGCKKEEFWYVLTLSTSATSLEHDLDIGTVRGAPASLRADRVRDRHHLPGNSAPRVVGHGATNTTAASRTTRPRTRALNAATAGTGRPSPIVARPRTPVLPAARSRNSGRPFILFVPMLRHVTERCANAGSLRRSAVFPPVDHLRILNHRSGSNAPRLNGRGAMNRAAASPTVPM